MKSAVFETAMSGFNQFTIILRKAISKGDAIKVFYWDYKAFDQNTFEKRLQSKLTSKFDRTLDDIRIEMIISPPIWVC